LTGDRSTLPVKKYERKNEMTEAEARTKCCPIISIINQQRSEEFTVSRLPRCIASECMMWRLSYTRGDDGFCGLAGAGGPYGYPPEA
jgi:hypothetical protein